MPLPMVHLGIARNVCNGRLQIADLPGFYLGNLAPDAVHMRAGYVPEDKRKSHLYARHAASIDHVIAFVKEIDHSEQSDYRLGYAIHVLTDIYWHDYVFDPFKVKYQSDAAPIQDQPMAYYNDTDQLDFVLYAQMTWRDEIWRYLEQAQGFDLAGLVSSEEVKLWNERTLKWFNGISKHANPIRYITLADLIGFIGVASRQCSEFLAEYLDES